MAEKKGEGISKEQLGAMRDIVLSDFFEDFYRQRRRIYMVNFLRGIWFGVGTFIGGTFVLAGLLWALSLFQRVPFLTEITQSIQHSIEDARQ